MGLSKIEPDLMVLKGAFGGMRHVLEKDLSKDNVGGVGAFILLAAIHGGRKLLIVSGWDHRHAKGGVKPRWWVWWR